MQALGTIRKLVRLLAAASLGLMLAWMAFSAWTRLVGRPVASRPSAAGREPSAEEHRDTRSSAGRTSTVVNAAPDLGSNAFSRPTVLQTSGHAESTDHSESSGHAETEHSEETSEEGVSEPPSVPTRGPDIVDASTLAAEQEAVARLVEVADRAYENGSLSESVLRYQFLLPNTRGPQRRLVAAKLGVAAENLSDFDTAARAYSVSLETQPHDELAAFARLRIGLILASQQEYSSARQHLSDWLLSGIDWSSSRYAQDAMHLLAEVQARIACGSIEDDATVTLSCLRDDRPAWPYRHNIPLMELREFDEAIDQTVVEPLEQVTRIELIDQLSPAPEDAFAEVQVSARPLAAVCDVLARKAGLSLAWSQAGYSRASERNVTLRLSGASVAVILDLLTRGSGLVWLRTDDGVVIAADSELTGSDLQLIEAAAARRLLAYAMATYPENDRSRLTTLSLANLDFHEQRLDDASNRYQQVMNAESDRIWMTEAAFNLGKVRLLLNDLPGAGDAFLRSNDISLGHPLQPAALLYAGRVHVSLNEVSRALPLFSRAWTLSRGSELEAEALICLCSTYAYLGNPMAASQLLVEHRDVVRDVGHYHDLAAFIGCYCRYSLAQTSARKLRDGRDLLDAIAHVDPQQFFSMQGWALVIQAHHRLGLDQECRSLLEQCVTSCDDSPFLDELVRGEASSFPQPAATGQGEATRGIDQLSAALGDETLHRLENIRALLDAGRHAELQADAEQLLQEPLSASMQSELLDLLGRSYQRQGEHYNAALCFARISPFSDRANRLRSEYLHEHPTPQGRTAP